MSPVIGPSRESQPKSSNKCEEPFNNRGELRPPTRPSPTPLHVLPHRLESETNDRRNKKQTKGKSQIGWWECTHLASLTSIPPLNEGPAWRWREEPSGGMANNIVPRQIPFSLCGEVSDHQRGEKETRTRKQTMLH